MSEPRQPRWLIKTGLMLLHDRSLALHGGSPGLRDEGLLESALARPENRFAYEGLDDIPALAATYAVAVSSNYPFIDGNKRTAFLAAGLFLEKNGLRLVAAPADAVLTMLSVASGEIGIDQLAEWLRSTSRPPDLAAMGLKRFVAGVGG